MWDDHLTVRVLPPAKRNDGDDDNEVSSRMSTTVIQFVFALCRLHTANLTSYSTSLGARRTAQLAVIFC